jgi:hypothetical protein
MSGLFWSSLVLSSSIPSAVRAEHKHKIVVHSTQNGETTYQSESTSRPSCHLIRETQTISGAHTKISFSLEQLDNSSRFVFDGIMDSQSERNIDFISSPIWQVMLAQLSTVPPGTPFPLNTELENGSLWVPLEHLTWGDECNDNTLQMCWNNLPLTQGGTIDIKVTVHIRQSDDSAEWSIAAQVSNPNLMIISTAFPLLEFSGIGTSHSDDVFIHPAFGGSLIQNPIDVNTSIPEFYPSTGDSQSSLIYPGELTSQFMSVYDDHLGLYLAAEDPGSSIKGLVYAFTPSKMRLWFRNYNRAILQTPTVSVLRALGHIDLADLGYPIVMGLFQGDWMDAANRYRSWAIGGETDMHSSLKQQVDTHGISPQKKGASFLSHGKIDTRPDIGEQIRHLSLMITYGFFFQDYPVNLSKDKMRLDSAIHYFRETQSDVNIAANLSGVIAGREDQGMPRESWYGSSGQDTLDGELKEQVPELISWLMTTHEVPSCHNRDSGNWVIEEGTTEKNIYNELDVLHRAIIRRWDGHPAFESTLHRLVCYGSPWQQDRHFNIIKNTILDSMGADQAGTGFQFIIMSGQGSVPTPCYAPLLANNNLDLHAHPVGGGCWYNDNLSAFVSRLRSIYTNLNPYYIVIPERDSEQLIGIPGIGMLAGKGRQYPYSLDISQIGGAVLPGSQPVPLLSFLYHDFVLLGSHPVLSSQYVDLFGANYGDHGRLLPHPNYYRAMNALNGHILNIGFRSSMTSQNEDSELDSPIYAELCATEKENRAFFQLLVQMRQRNPEHLAWGQMLRPPVVESDTVYIEAHRDGQLQSYPANTVLMSAFKARDYTIKLFSANYTRQVQTFNFSFNPAHFQIKHNEFRTLNLIDIQGNASIIGQVSGDRKFQSETLSLNPLSVQIFILTPK